MTGSFEITSHIYTLTISVRGGDVEVFMLSYFFLIRTESFRTHATMCGFCKHLFIFSRQFQRFCIFEYCINLFFSLRASIQSISERHQHLYKSLLALYTLDFGKPLCNQMKWGLTNFWMLYVIALDLVHMTEP